MALSSAFRKQKSIARARHENANGWLKQLNVLATFFRRSKPREEMKKKRAACFNAAAAITQLKLSHGERLHGAGCGASYF